MPEEEKKMVDIDTSGPGADIEIEETKDESVVDTGAPKQENVQYSCIKTQAELEKNIDGSLSIKKIILSE